MGDRDILTCASENDIEGIEKQLKAGVDVNTTISFSKFLFNLIFIIFISFFLMNLFITFHFKLFLQSFIYIFLKLLYIMQH